MTEEKKYHKSRIMFAIINDNLHLVDNDERSHKEWLEQDFGLNQNHFNDINRGCIKDSIIMVYKGQNFTSISENELSKIIIMVAHKLELDLTKYTVYNGVKVGAIGETWGAIKVHSGSEFL